MRPARTLLLAALTLLGAALSFADPREEHWAYVAPVRPAVPADVPRTIAEWARNPVDYFVGRRLAQEGLAPAPEAERALLIRRLSLDLTGLPPAPDDVDAFLADDAPDAYERLVERLLASPHYGEQQARTWLDLARYADSDGYEKDDRRTMWRYRDWVIDAFNRDLPFDRFTIAQLAGDLLPDASTEHRIATGFHRNTMTNKEGGADPEEWRVAAVKDRVNTTAEVWLGATMECAQCHDHKFDPFSQVEYYGLYAFFDHTEDIGNSNAPMIDAPLPADIARKAELEEELEVLERELATQTPALDAELARWIAAWRPLLPSWRPLRPTSAAGREGSRLAVLNDGSILGFGELVDREVYEVQATAPPGTITALRLEVMTDPSLPENGPGRAAHRNFVLNEVVVRAAGVDVALARARADFHQTDKPWLAAGIVDGDLETGWAIGGEIAPHHVILELAQPLSLTEPTELELELHQLYGGGHLIGRFRLSATAAEIPATGPVPSPALVPVLGALERTAPQETALAEFFRAQAPALDTTRARVKSIRSEMEYPTAMVMRERAEPRTTRLHVRGNFLDLGREITAGTPDVLHPFEAGEARPTRLDLARWLVVPENPLTARVTVNRYWQQLFGIGLVSTPNDFGTQGEPPSHPELLDWLALEFREQGWSVKQLMRLLVGSATYRQSSVTSAALHARDPKNRLLGRGPRVRVDAETVRDIALEVSGLLCPEVGGPSVFPPQPEGTWMMTYSGDRWETSAGCDRYRRGLYTFWRRTAPYPTFMLFDATSREVACSHRPLSDTPLQALALLNDPAFFELAGGLARRMMIEGGTTPAERAAYGFRLCATRTPEPEEVELLVSLYETELSAFASSGTAAGTLLATFEEQGDDTAGLDPLELAAWTVVANALFNLDETITKG